MDITELVQQSQNGDAAAFAQIYDLFAGKIFRFVRLKVQHPQQAEDILQDVFVKAWKGLPTIRLENLNFNAWLYKVASNTLNDHLRRVYRTPEILQVHDDLDVREEHGPADYAAALSDAAIVRKAMADLPQQYQQILELRFIQDFSIQETADILGKSNLAVRLAQHRALNQLKIILSKLYDVEHKKIQ